ncbi:hypothetical protein E1100_08945 [Vibrio owensii]|nr:hypothetical protein E1100_08945 [Vibrio owensii]
MVSAVLEHKSYRNAASFLRETGDGRRETGDGRRETGDGRRETGDGRRETGDGRRFHFVYLGINTVNTL